MEKNNSFELFVQGDNARDKACKLIRTEGTLQVEFKLKSRDKNVPSKVIIDAVEVVDQITAAMNKEERLKAYANLIARMPKTEK